jgi:hypothetical protein
MTTTYQTRFTSHSIHNTLKSIESTFGSEKFKPTRPDLVASHARLFKVLAYLRHRSRLSTQSSGTSLPFTIR